MTKKLVTDDQVNKDLLGTIIHFLLEDDHNKAKRHGHSLLVKIELQDKFDREYVIQGTVGNEDYVVTSLRFYDPVTDIKKGDVVKQIEQQTLESAEEQY